MVFPTDFFRKSECCFARLLRIGRLASGLPLRASSASIPGFPRRSRSSAPFVAESGVLWRAIVENNESSCVVVHPNRLLGFSPSPCSSAWGESNNQGKLSASTATVACADPCAHRAPVAGFDPRPRANVSAGLTISLVEGDMSPAILTGGLKADRWSSAKWKEHRLIATVRNCAVVAFIFPPAVVHQNTSTFNPVTARTVCAMRERLRSGKCPHSECGVGRVAE